MINVFRRPLLAAAVGVACTMFSGVVSAQQFSSSSEDLAHISVREPVTTELIRVTSLYHMLAISNAVSSRNGNAPGPQVAGGDTGRYFGMAAGNAIEKWNIWGSLSGDGSHYNGGSVAKPKFSANTTNTVLGADYALTPTLAVGLSTAFDQIRGSAGSAFVANDYKVTGYSVAPYVGWQINQELSLDAMAGWGEGKLTGVVNVKPDRFFYGTNLTYTRWFGNWQVSGKASYLHGQEKYGTTSTSPVSSTNEMDEWRLGAQAGYWMNGFMPYVGLAFVTDDRSTTRVAGAVATNDIGNNAVLWTVGANIISLKNNLTGGIAFSTESGRKYSGRDTVMANINYRF